MMENGSVEAHAKYSHGHSSWEVQNILMTIYE